jgi:hypothetical protein
MEIVIIVLLFHRKKVRPYYNLNNLDRKDGNNWNSGPAPPPPPGTPPTPKGPSHKSGGNASPSGSGAGGGSKKSGIGAGGIAGIIISIFLVGGIVAFFLVKRRSRRSSDIEKLDNQPLAPLSSTNDVPGRTFFTCAFHFVEHHG